MRLVRLPRLNGSGQKIAPCYINPETVTGVYPFGATCSISLVSGLEDIRIDATAEGVMYALMCADLFIVEAGT